MELQECRNAKWPVLYLEKDSKIWYIYATISNMLYHDIQIIINHYSVRMEVTTIPCRQKAGKCQ
jgi:hypothetical protein